MSAGHHYPGPHDIRRVILPNGITVLARPNFSSPSVVISGHLPAGALFDTDEKLGLADFTATSLMRGTTCHTHQQIYDLLESAGAGLGFSGGTHTTAFGGRSLVEDLDMLLELLGNALRSPIFPPEHVERLRAQYLTSLALRTQDTGEMASLTFDRLVFRRHPYARPDDGYPETIRRLARADLVDFHTRCYGPRGLVIAVVGGIEPQAAVDKVFAALGDWQNPGQPDPPPLPALHPLRKEHRKQVRIPGKSQSDIIMGTIGPTRCSPDYLAVSLGNSVLGQFGMYGRIGKSVREQAGLAYYAYSSAQGGIGPGAWYAAAGVDPANVEQAIDLIKEEIARFIREPVSPEELADSQSSYLGRLPLSLESNGGVASALLSLERYHLGLDYYERYPALVQSITPEQVLEAAQRYLDVERMGIAVAGS